jgi:hypothetical protein
MAGVVRAEILDRILAIVNSKIITLSDVRRARQVRLIIGEKDTGDNELLKELVDAQIIDEQAIQFLGTEVNETVVDEEMKKINDLRGLPLDFVHEAIRRRVRIQEFLDLRFRQFLRTTDDEVRKYYDSVFVPRAQQQGVNPIPPFEQISEMIRDTVTNEKLADDIDNWLEAIRRRSDIEIFE